MILEFDVVCTCGEELDYNVTTSPDGKIDTLTITPCSHCKEETYDSGFASGFEEGQDKGYSDGYEEGKAECD